MKPHIFEIRSAVGIPSHINYGFVNWLEEFVNTRKKDDTSPMYQRKTNPLIVKSDEAKLIKKNFDESILPYVVINGEISGDELKKTKKAIEKAAREYYGSFDAKNKGLELVEIKNPGNDERFQNFLIHELVVIGGYQRCSLVDKQRKMLPEYVSLFCLNSEMVKTLSGKIIMDRIRIEKLEDYMGPGD